MKLPFGFEEILDENDKPIENIGQIFDKVVMASYLYCIEGVDSPLTDTLFDLYMYVLKDNWDTFEHNHKHLIREEDFEQGSLFHLKSEDYGEYRVSAVFWRAEHFTGGYMP